MNRQIQKIFFGILFLFALSIPCFAQAGDQPEKHDKYDIVSIVTDKFDNPAIGIRVYLRSASNQNIVPASLTGPTGEVRFAGLDPGEYYLVIEEYEYEQVRNKVTLTYGPARVYIQVRKKGDASSPAGNGTASAEKRDIPRKAREALDKGMALVNKGDAKGGIEQYQKAIKEYPTFYEAYTQMSIAQARLGDIPGAEQSLRKSIELSSNLYAESYFLLAELLNNQNRQADAEPIAKQAITLDGNNFRGHYELASALFRLNRHPEAEQAAKKACSLKPDSSKSFLLLANIHIKLRNYPAVVEDFDSYLKLEPTGPQSDQVRKTREQVVKAIEKSKASPAPQPASK